MRRLMLILLGMLFISTQLLAQRSIAGRVVDDSGQPVAGASVVVKNTKVGTVTDATGNFALSLPATAKAIVISGVGYAAQEIAIGSGNSYSVSLKKDEAAMQEVVVTGYTRERRQNFTGAASVLSSKAVETVPVGSFDQALQGRAPGMLVNSGSGQPGASANIQIRGPQSIQGAFAQPLFVIDGVPMPSFDMQTINANDFESITILKDASASALYGARGGTGVIVITTKKGRAGGTNFTFRTQTGVTERPDFSRLNMMNTSEILAYEERIGLITNSSNTALGTPGWVYSLKNPANASLPATSPAGNPYAPSQARYTAILDSIRGIDMNYADLFYRKGISQTHELNMSGGSEKTRFYASGQYMKQQGIDLGSDLNRYTGRFNLEHTANKLTVSWNTLGGFSKVNFAEGDWQGNSPRNPFQMTFRAKPYENPYKADGTLNYGASTNLNLKQVANLLEGIQNSNWRQNQIKVNSGLTLSYKLFPTLTLRNMSGIDVSENNYTRFVNPNSYIGTLQTYKSGTYLEAFQTVSQLINTSSAIFNKRFAEKHDVEVGGYFEVIRGRQKGFSMQMYNLDPRLGETGQGAGALPIPTGTTTLAQNATGAKSGFGIRSYFSTLRYTFDNRITLTGNIRRDGTSRIVNVANREITTWSAGLRWNALREGFMANQKIFSDLVFRASYGIVPNIGSIPTSSYALNGTITSITNYQGPQLPSFGTTSYAGSTITGLRPTAPGNADLRIENIKKAGIGTDFAVWNNRARFGVDFYKNKTVDLFVNQPLPAESGFGTLAINAGVMTNKGVELQANIDVIKSKNVNFSVNANHAINKNNIESLGSVSEYFLGTFQIKVGLPYGSHYTYNYLGADPATGKPMYETVDGKTTLDPAQAAQFAKFGSFIPKHVGGFGADLTVFQRFSVSALFSYQFDVVRSNNTRNWITRGTVGYQASVNGSRELLTNQWQKPGDVALFQSPVYDRGFTSSDLEDAKFLRFRNLQIGYNIPSLRAGGTQVIKGGRLYVQGQNLAIWSPWRGIDPEDNNNISLNEYPNPRMFVVGLDVNF